MGRDRLVIRSYGLPPLCLLDSVIQGWGLSVTLVREDGREEGVDNIEELGFPAIIDFSDRKDRRVTITYLTHDPRVPKAEFVPFLRRIAVDRGINYHDLSHAIVLLAPQKPEDGEVKNLVNEILSLAGGHAYDMYDDIEICLQQLRNIGLADPDTVERAFELIEQKGYCGIDDLIMIYRTEISAARKVYQTAAERDKGSSK